MKRALLCLVLLSACDCGTEPMEGACMSTTDCAADFVCVDNLCVLRSMPDAGMDMSGDTSMMCELPCRGGRLCCAEGEECVDDTFCLPVCENARCGDDGAVCCDSGEVCLDGVVCVADCGEDALCGADLDVCCPSGDVCINDGCVTPGIECGDDFDCLMSGVYCEQTVGRCFEIPEVEPACEVLPDFDDVELAVEWHWTGVMDAGKMYEQVVATPVVGDVSGDGIPDVVVPAYATGGDAVLVALSGDDGTLLWHIPAGANGVEWRSSAALGNFDDDDALEVVYVLEGAGGVRIVDGDGVTEIARRATNSARVGVGNPTLADFNADGTPDVVLGCMVMNGLDISDAGMDFFDAGTCSGPSGQHSTAVADLDGDGEPDVTTGSRVYDTDGTVLWDAGDSTRFPAVADLDGDGLPEIVSVGSGTVHVRNAVAGDMLIGPGGAWQDATFAIPGGGTGGPPTIADFDGDGLPEIATAGRGAYVVYDPDCLTLPPREGGDCEPGGTDFLRWQAPTQDISSSVTGSSVFDFQGDGVAEVVYNDECFLHIYDGRDGTELLSEPRPNSSRTGFEYPLVVDVDRDGNSEIVVPANRDQAVRRDNCPDLYRPLFDEIPEEFAIGTRGVYSFGDPGDRWVRTRPIWNQYEYHVTNVDDRGVVPPMETDNWSVEGLNNYRQNVQGEGAFNAPNLQVELEAVLSCAGGAIRLSATVRNVGGRGAPAGVEVVFVQTTPGPEVVIATVETTTALLPGGSERITVTAMDVPLDTEIVYEVRVDGDTDTGTVIECVEDDNEDVAMGLCSGLG